ncbi:family 78 glycoside hydrolase catalytic domain [Candidatus Sumerlaeota bacterium]
MNTSQLTCEYAINPLGLDAKSPRFGWILEAEERGVVQSAYRVLVASSPEKLNADEGDKWDSGKVLSDRSVNIPYEGAALASAEKCWWKVCVWDQSGKESSSQEATFEMGLLSQSDWKGDWIGADKSVPAPLVRKEFEIPQGVTKARLYVSGIGWSECYINGMKISDRVLDPCASEYGKSVYYVTHDVTQDLKTGANAIGVWLGNGWFSEPDSAGPGSDEIWRFSSRYGDSPRVMVQLDIEFADGEKLEISSDEEWRTTGSCITQNDFYFGERYDARLELPGWSEPHFDDAGWSPARLKEAPGGVLRAQIMPPIRVVQARKPISITEPKPGVFVCQFGQLFGGWVRLRVKGPAGSLIEIKYSERIHDETGLIDKRQHESPRATDYYILKGDDAGEVYEPRFTYHPVAFVQIEGLSGELSIDDVDGCVVHTDEDMSGDFQCANDLLNKIHQNVKWTLTNGLYGMPLDCLYREHWAWTDPATITGTLYPRKQMPRFWSKWLRDIADSQGDDGSVPVLCPSYKWTDWWDPAWGGNYPQLVWYLHQYFDDERLLEEHYDGIRRTVDHLSSVAEEFLILKGFWGDHMLPGSAPGEEEFVSSETPRGLVWTGYFYRGALAVAQAAQILGRSDDATKYADIAGKVKRAFNAKWLDADKGIYAEGSQTSQAFPLALDIVPAQQRQSVIDCLIKNITDKHNNHHNTGNTGTTCLIDCLTTLGYGEVMWKIATNTTYPGWGYMVDHGATTIWESWSLGSDSGNAESMIMWGTIDEFFYNDLAGIQGPDYYGQGEMAPGFKHIHIAPFIPDDLDHARASMRTVRGTVASSWQRAKEGITLDVNIPANCSATICVPKMGLSHVSVTEGATTLWKNKSVSDIVDGLISAAETDNNVTFEVGSGSYSFALTGER